jgi:outer membrane protein TolC
VRRIVLLSILNCALFGEQTLSLNEAVVSTLQCQWNVRIAVQDIVEAEGVLRETAGPFNPLVGANGRYTWRWDAQEDGIKSNERGSFTFGLMGIEKKFRAGTRVRLEADLDRDHSPQFFQPFDYVNTGVIRFNIDQPILRDFLYGRDRMQEQASCYALETARWETLFSISSDLLTTINRYWDARAAELIFEARLGLEQRLERIVSFTKRMIEEDQMARADIEQPLAELERARRDRLEAGQDYFAAVNALRLAMGWVDLDWDWPSFNYSLEPIPEVSGEAAELDYYRLAPLICAQRGDVQGADYRILSSHALVTGDRNATLPQLDLNLGVDVLNSENNGQAQKLLGSYEYDHPERGLRLGVRFSYPLGNDEACGRLRQRRAELAQNCLRKDELLQTALTDFMTGLRDYNSLIDQYGAARAAEEHFTILTRNEALKLEIGESTLFVMLDFERELTQAEIERILTTTRYAQTLASLHFLTGTLVTCDPETQGYEVRTMQELAHLPVLSRWLEVCDE